MFGWLNCFCCLSKDYEYDIVLSEVMFYLVMIYLMLKCFCKI